MNFDFISLKPMYSRTCYYTPRTRVLFCLPLCLLLASCGANPVKITQESFSIDSPYKSRLDSNSTVACESARRVLLGDGYITDVSSEENIRGRKAYRSDDDRSTFIDMNVVCVDEPKGSTVYANGLLSTYDVKRSGGSASVGVSALGSVSLPFGRSADSMVKISDETIRDREFYRRFFKAVNVVMSQIKKASEDTVQPALYEQQKQDEGVLDNATPGDGQEEKAIPPIAAEELPPTPQAEPARTAEALEKVHPKLEQDSDAAPVQSDNENSPVDTTKPLPAVDTPGAADESMEPTVTTTPDPATAPEPTNQPAAADPVE